jgi:iron-sulfur cluster repair protein YtfE (RIC family)
MALGAGEDDTMNHDPIDRLLQEHEAIIREVAKLRVALATLGSEGAAALPRVLPALRAAVGWLDHELPAHARREDEALFPVLERELGESGGPTEVMRAEHRAIHAQAERMRATLRELNEVQHPALVRAGEAIKQLAAAGDDAAALRASTSGIIALLDEHFAKEEDILFPMAREFLTPQALEEIARRIDELDRE